MSQPPEKIPVAAVFAAVAAVLVAVISTYGSLVAVGKAPAFWNSAPVSQESPPPSVATSPVPTASSAPSVTATLEPVVAPRPLPSLVPQKPEQPVPAALMLTYEEFMARRRSNRIQPSEYLGHRVSWDLEASMMDDAYGPTALGVNDDKMFVIFPAGDQAVRQRAASLESGDLIRVSGTLEKHSFMPGDPVLVAPDFQLLRRRR